MSRSKQPLLTVALVLLAFTVMGRPAAGQRLEGIRGDGEPLVTQFNADVGKVRAVFLASPT